MSRNPENKPIDFDPSRRTELGKNFAYHDGSKSLEKLGAGDSFYVPNFYRPARDQDGLFAQLLKEVEFEQMFNFVSNTVDPIPRLIAAQTDKSGDGSPIYRMPGCNESNIPTKHWTKTVKKVVDLAAVEVGHSLNHCVITLFRDGRDSLAYHHDKMLDLTDDTYILSVSFGAARPIVFEPVSTKPSLQRQTLVLRPGSMLAIGPRTNELFQHAVPKVRPVDVGPRISLSIRSIASLIYSEKQNEFAVLGKGKEHQTRNYPFVKSRDNKSEYTPEIAAVIAKERNAAKQKLGILLAEILDKATKDET